MKESYNKQYLYINMIKGIAVFLMLWGHVIQYSSVNAFDFYENIVFKIIYSFHMPLFMLVSGYLFYFSSEKRTMSELLIRRTQSLIQPIVMCGILFYFLTTGVKSVILEHNLEALFDGKWLDSLNGFWFLWSALASAFAVGIAIKSSDKRWIQGMLLFIGSVLVILFPNAEMNLYMYPYFVVGFLYAKYNNFKWVKKVTRLRYISLGLFPVMISFFAKEHYIYTTGFLGDTGLLQHMPINLYRWAIGFCGCVFILTLLNMVFSHFISDGKEPKLFLYVGKLGGKSLQIYILSCIFLSEYYPLVYGMIINKIGFNFPTFNMIFYNFVFTFVIAVLYALILFIIVRLLERLKVSNIIFAK